MPSSAQLELVVYYLGVSYVILTQLAHADTAYNTQFPCKAELHLEKLTPTGWWLGGANGEIKNKAKLSLNWA